VEIKYINLPLFNYRKHDHNLTKNKLELFKNRSKIINKFSKIKSKKKLNIICVVPIRDHEKDKSISPFFKINKIKIIDLNLKEILKVKNIDKIIVSTDSKKIIQYVNKKYKKKITMHIRKKNQSGINQSYKLAVIDAIKKNSKKRVDILLIIHLNYPIKNKIYIEQAIDMTILHETDLTISSKPEIWNNYYIQKNSTLELIGNDNNSNLRFEKKIIYKECGGIYSYNYQSFLKNKLKKISNVIIDDVSSLMINNLDDLKKLNKINSQLKIEKKLIN
jgi:CMP-N-acetylneuraminic acid synthetase